MNLPKDLKEITEDGYKILPKQLVARIATVLTGVVFFLVYVIGSNYSAGVSAGIDSNNERITRLEAFALCTIHNGKFTEVCARGFNQ